MQIFIGPQHNYLSSIFNIIVYLKEKNLRERERMERECEREREGERD
jgi:hypothetical protein